MAGGSARRKRIWVQQVAVDAAVLQTRLNAARARRLTPAQKAVAAGVAEHIQRARDAAFRDDPIPGRWANWWHGTLVEAAYRNMHAAQTALIDLYDEPELQAEARHALARARVALHREDPRQTTLDELQRQTPGELRARLRRLVNDSYAAIDGQHAQLRSFRNVLLLSALVVLLLTTTTVVIGAAYPDVIPLCFENTELEVWNCPSRSGAPERRHFPGDVPVVALIGALGGALAATVAIRNLRGTNSPYDVPVALAVLKFPLGAFSAILALLAIRGEFVPGLKNLDSQEQILAYALVFGYAQQAFTRLLDERAQTLLDGLPGKDSHAPVPAPVQAVVDRLAVGPGPRAPARAGTPPARAERRPVQH